MNGLTYTISIEVTFENVYMCTLRVLPHPPQRRGLHNLLYTMTAIYNDIYIQ